MRKACVKTGGRVRSGSYLTKGNSTENREDADKGHAPGSLLGNHFRADTMTIISLLTNLTHSTVPHTYIHTICNEHYYKVFSNYTFIDFSA